MGKIGLGRVMNCFSVSSGLKSSWFCINSVKTHDEMEQKPLITSDLDHLVRPKDVAVPENQTLASQPKPKMVMLRVSMHCNGCARKVEKHISKMEGVTSYKVDLESKMVEVIGDVTPVQVLESVSKVKNAEFWSDHVSS
ncbi:HMA domain-containing protein [Psidium guajava]|nr:HMA domain-containing protein [Psidium guajava]